MSSWHYTWRIHLVLLRKMESTVGRTEQLLRVTWVWMAIWTLLLAETCSVAGCSRGSGLNLKGCGKPPAPSTKHSIRTHIDEPIVSGSKAHYGCEPGYKYISGPTHSTCKRHGQWQPKVIRINCQVSQRTSEPTSTAPTRPVSDDDPQDRRGLSTESVNIPQSTSGPTLNASTRPAADADPQNRRGLSSKSVSKRQVTSGTTSTAPTRPLSDADPQERGGLSTESVNNEAGVYQERVSSGSTLHNACPFILLSLLLYQKQIMQDV